MVCLIDNSNIINICYSTFVKLLHDKNGPDYVIKEDDLGFFWHLYVNKIKDYLSSYKELIFCGEGHNSTKWRKEQYALYKENRKDRAENPDYAFIVKCYKEVEDFLKNFHCKAIRVENCEADDVIYKLSEYYTNKGEQVKIISSDKDLTQICGFFDGVSVYNPMSSINKKCVAITNAENYNENIILEKAVVGDASDNIKGIPRCGAKTFEKMLADKSEWNKVMLKPENADLFEKLLNIVDLRRFPKNYQENIIQTFENTPFNKFEPMGVEKFYLEKNLNQCLKDWSSLSSDIQLMLSGNESNETSAEDEILAMLAED